jgi:hypothetical protein
MIKYARRFLEQNDFFVVETEKTSGATNRSPHNAQVWILNCLIGWSPSTELVAALSCTKTQLPIRRQPVPPL